MRESADRDKRHRLRASSAELRLRSIKAQLSTGFTMCSFVESCISKGRIGEAYSSVARLRQTIESVHNHLDKPHYAPPDSLAEVRDELERLEARLVGIETRLPVKAVDKSPYR